MNKALLIVAGLIVVLAIAVKAQAVDPPPDFGETNKLLVACNSMWEAAEQQEFVVRNCRRAAPDEENGYRAIVHIRLMTHVGPIFLAVRFYKTLWAVTTVVQEYQPTSKLTFKR